MKQLIQESGTSRFLHFRTSHRIPLALYAVALLLITFLLLFASCGRQHNPKVYRDYSRYSYVDSVAVTDSAIENLAILGKVWGFVKYYHPVFEDSVFNIDYELFELLPKIIPSDYAVRNQVLCDWIDSLGAFETDEGYYKKILADTTVRKTISYDWMNDAARISPELSSRLNRLIYARRTGNNVYAGIAKRKEPLTEVYRFSRENAYGNLTFLDGGYRLLALFRYWNMVEYYYSAKHQIDRSLDEVLQEYIPTFISSSMHNDYRATCYRLISEIHDTHAGVSFPQGFFGRNILPLWIKFVEGSWVITHAPKDANGLKQGDILQSIDGIPVNALVAKFRSYLSYSNEAAFYRDAADCLHRTSKSSVTLKYKRNDSLIEYRMKSGPPDMQDRDKKHTAFLAKYPPYIRLNDSTGYICSHKYAENEIKKSLLPMIKGIDRLIVDIRYGASFEFSSFVRKYFANFEMYLPEYKIIESFPGFNRMQSDEFPAIASLWRYKGKIIILVNEWTQSYSEQVALILSQIPGTKIIGNTTAGAVSMVNFISLPGGIATAFTGREMYSPKGTTVQGPGVPLDEEVPITIQGIKEGRDEVYERAVELIKKL